MDDSSTAKTDVARAAPPAVKRQWRRPTLRKISALDAEMAKGRARVDALHLS